MTETLIPGLKHQILLTVEKHHTADAYGNPGVEVFATPALITLFENVCGASVYYTHLTLPTILLV